MHILTIICSSIGAILLAASSFMPCKKHMLIIQIGDCIFNGLADLLAGSWTGFIANTIAGIRNTINARDKLTKPLVILFAIANPLLSIIPLGIPEKINTIYLLQLMPTLASIQYTIWTYKVKDIQMMRVGLTINMIFWCIHDIGMGLYPSMVADFIIIAVTIINILKEKMTEGNCITKYSVHE